MRRGFNDARGNVFLRFIDLAIELQPRYLVIENVRGLLSAPLQHRPHAERGSGKRPLDVDELPGGALQYVIDLLEKAGYSVEFNLYNAANYGVPQTRERVVLICAREGGRVGFLEPTHSQNGKHGLKSWRTFQEATFDLPEPHHHINFPEDRLKYYKLIGPGQHWRSLPLDLQKEAMGNSFFAGGGKTGFFRRVAWDKPAPTLVTHPAMPATDLAHPVEQRPLSIEEYRRLQMFPDGWIIQGPLIQQYKQLGNAVPVGLGHAVGHAIMGHEMGRAPTIPQGFEFSRYRNTSRDEWVAAHARETRGDGLFADL
jgi:DNA (cytosine-5)-methyltransferase 1